MIAIRSANQTPLKPSQGQFRPDTGETVASAPEQGFAATLHRVGAKPAHKSASGGNLPDSGNPPPRAAAAACAGPVAVPTSPASAAAAAQNLVSAQGNSSPSQSATAIAGAVADHAPLLTASGEASAAVSPGAPQGSASASIVQVTQTAEGAQTAQAARLALAAQIAQAAPAAAASSSAASGPSSQAAGGTAVPIDLPTARPAPLKGAGPDGHAQKPSPADTPSPSSPASLSGGRGAAALRAANETLANPNRSFAKSDVPALDPQNVALPDGGVAAAPSASPPVLTSTVPAISASAGDLAVSGPSGAVDVDAPLPAGVKADANLDAASIVVDAGDAAAARPAIAAAAASAAQLVSSLAAAASADKHLRNTPGDAPGLDPSASATGAQLLNASATAGTDAAMPTFKVNAAVDSADFSQGVASHVSMMLDNQMNSAKLQVNPPALGPIEVRIAVQGDHAQVWMSSHSAVTRDALQDTTPQLRDLLSSQGFTHVSVDISQRSFQERTPTAQAYEWTADRGASSAAGGGAPSTAIRTANGILDTYA